MSNQLLQKICRSLPHENCSGKFEEIWAKYPSHHQHLPAPTPMW